MMFYQLQWRNGGGGVFLDMSQYLHLLFLERPHVIRLGLVESSGQLSHTMQESVLINFRVSGNGHGSQYGSNGGMNARQEETNPHAGNAQQGVEEQVLHT